MEQIIEFSINHWEMVLAFFAMLAMWLFSEQRKAAPGLSPQQAVVMSNNDDTLVLDIRAAADFKTGWIMNSKNIPFAELQKRLDDLKKHQDKPIVLVCKTGQTSGSAASMMKKAGYTQVHRMTGGMTEWVNQGLPLVRK